MRCGDNFLSKSFISKINNEFKQYKVQIHFLSIWEVNKHSTYSSEAKPSYSRKFYHYYEIYLIQLKLVLNKKIFKFVIKIIFLSLNWLCSSSLLQCRDGKNPFFQTRLGSPSEGVRLGSFWKKFWKLTSNFVNQNFFLKVSLTKNNKWINS